MSPRVSVIIPTFNRKEWLAEAVDSVLNQTFREFEILVIDHGSTDGTRAMLAQRFSDRVRVVSISNCPLPACPRNAGIEVARGEYVAFLDSDDLWVPDKLALQVKALDRHPEYGWSYGNMKRFGSKETKRGREVGCWQFRSGRVFDALLMGNFIPLCTVMVRRVCFSTVGVFDLDPLLRAAEDYELWLRLAARYPIWPIRCTLALYRESPAQMSADPRKSFGSEKKALELVRLKLGLSSEIHQKALAAMHLRYFRYNAASGESAIYGDLLESRRLNGRRWRVWWYEALWRAGGATLVRSWISLERWGKRWLSF